MSEGGDLAKTGEKKMNQKEYLAHKMRTFTRIARFKGATLIEEDGRWVDMSSTRFAEAMYKVAGDGLKRATVTDVEHLFRATAQDLTDKAHYIAFDGDLVWDTKKVDWTNKVPAEDCVYRVSGIPQSTTNEKIIDENGRMRFIMDLANGDEGVYDDIMQTVAPLLLDRKPTGVIWYLGGGANGKSTLVHLLYILFGNFLTEITVKQLEDERDAPQLNGKLGNICKESSEGFVEDTRTYKSIGTHENFLVHKFHSQDMVEIEGNVHHIFSANNIPTFGDKSDGTRRRTLVIPFNNRFKPDEQFEDRTFTPEFIDHFITEMIKYAKLLKEQRFEYLFSPITMAMKEKYDNDANTAQTYVDSLVDEDIVGFNGYAQLLEDYEGWCSENGYRSSSINVLRRAADDKGFVRKSIREEGGKVRKMYLYKNTGYPQVESVTSGGNNQMRRFGLYRIIDSEYKGSAEIPEEETENRLGNW